MYYFDGASGSRYIYGKFNLENVLSLGWPVPYGNFILTKDSADIVDIIYVGESPDVWKTLTQTSIWPEARHSHGANTIYARPGSDEPLVRHKEARDLIEQWSPPMNGPDTAGKDQE